MATTDRIVLYTGNDNCAAWYLDGQLMGEGEETVVLEQVFAEVQVQHRVSNEFLRGTTGSGTMAAPTLREAEAYGAKLAADEEAYQADRKRVATLRSIADDAQAEIARIEARRR